MIILRDPFCIAQIANAAIQKLAALRISQLQSSEDPEAPDANGCFIVVEADDTIEQLEQEIGLPILHGLFDDLPFDHPDFQPCSEILEEHDYEQHRIYEMVFIGSDDGTFTCLLIPDEEGIDTNLLAMCRSFATPAVKST